MITYNLCNKIDIIRERNRFYGNFNCILRKFYYVDLQIFLTLFNSFCLCFYGTELWFENFNCKTIKKQFAIGYHKAVKKILQVPWRESNHAVCNALNLLVFDDLINLRSVKFCHKIFRFKPFYIFKCFYYFKDNSCLYKHCDHLMMNTYGVRDFIDNDIDALIARIYFICKEYNSNEEIT